MGSLQLPPRGPCEQARGPGGGQWWRSLSSSWRVHLRPGPEPAGPAGASASLALDAATPCWWGCMWSNTRRPES